MPQGQLACKEVNGLFEALDVLLPWEEDQDVPRRLVDMDLEERAQRSVDVVRLALRALVDLDRVLAALDVDDLRTAGVGQLIARCREHRRAHALGKEPAELLRVERRTHNNNFERIPLLPLPLPISMSVPFAQDALEIRKQQVSAQRTLVRLVDHNDRVSAKQRVTE